MPTQTNRLSYSIALSILWSMVWRYLLLQTVIAVAVSGLVGAVTSWDAIFAFPLLATAGYAVIALSAALWSLKVALAKPHRGCRIELRRAASP